MPSRSRGKRNPAKLLCGTVPVTSFQPVSKQNGRHGNAEISLLDLSGLGWHTNQLWAAKVLTDGFAQPRLCDIVIINKSPFGGQDRALCLTEYRCTLVKLAGNRRHAAYKRFTVRVTDNHRFSRKTFPDEDVYVHMLAAQSNSNNRPRSYLQKNLRNSESQPRPEPIQECPKAPIHLAQKTLLLCPSY